MKDSWRAEENRYVLQTVAIMLQKVEAIPATRVSSFPSLFSSLISITANRMSRWSTFIGKFSNISVVIFFYFSIEFSWKAFKPVRNDLTASKPRSISL